MAKTRMPTRLIWYSNAYAEAVRDVASVRKSIKDGEFIPGPLVIAQDTKMRGQEHWVVCDYISWVTVLDSPITVWTPRELVQL